MNNNALKIPTVSIQLENNPHFSTINELGMRPMQERVYAKRGEQYLLIKSPPASGKSRALMFIALDKLHQQGLRQALIIVPERSIGGSFSSEKLTEGGFYWDWMVEPQWNLCDATGQDASKVAAVERFLVSAAPILVCTHATFRFAVEKLGMEAFDNRLLAVDEFHHVSSNTDANKLGNQLSTLITRDKTHIVAMTGSYFRGDSAAVLSPEDENRFQTVTYTYYEQLNGYQWLKSLDIGYYFYTGRYVEAVKKVLDTNLKTIVHIPNVNSRESLKDKEREVNEIFETLGTWQSRDEATGFHLLQTPDGRILKVADLVDDSDLERRSKILTALKDPTQKNNRDHVDIIIALGMAKEGFDWIWCEHALTIGYRSSLTEIVQIIGRATRDAPHKTRTRFTNLIAEPTASQGEVAEAVNDMLKAIAASLLMEQVLAPRYTFTPKNQGTFEALEGFDYGAEGYQTHKTNVGVNHKTGHIHLEIKGLAQPKSPEAIRICQEDLNEVLTGFLQDKVVLERGVLENDHLPEDNTIIRMGKIIQSRYPELSDEDKEAVRQHAVSAINTTQQIKLALQEPDQGEVQAVNENSASSNMSFITGVRKFVNVRDLSIELIDHINPFEAAYAMLAKTMNTDVLQQVQEAISNKEVPIDATEAKDLAQRAVMFKRDRGRLPEINSPDNWERQMARGVAAYARFQKEAKKKGQSK